jgi:cytochrome c-type biogenesis protein CcmH
MPATDPVSAQKPLPIARMALIVAALIALVAVGFAMWRQQPAAPAKVAMTDELPEDVNLTISKLEARLKANPNDAEGWRMLGWSFYQTEKFAEAAQAYARATQINPQKAEYWSALGEARVLAGPGDVSADAKTAFQKAVALDPQDPRARYFLGVAKDMAGDHKGAIEDWFALLKDTPAGAPWEASVRKLIGDVGAKEKIDVASRLAALKPAAPTGGAAIATAGIPGPTPDQMKNAAQMPKGQQDAMIDGMVNGLEAKLKTNPDNPQGWIMLMRSRIQLGQTIKASEAFRNGKAAFANDSVKRGTLEAAAAELGIKG